MKKWAGVISMLAISVVSGQWVTRVLPGPPPGHPAHSTVRIVVQGDTLGVVNVGRLNNYSGILVFGIGPKGEGAVEEWRWEVIDTLIDSDNGYDGYDYRDGDGWGESADILFIDGHFVVIYEDRDRQALVLATRVSPRVWQRQDICQTPHPTLIDALNMGDSIFVGFHTLVGNRCSFCVCRGTVDSGFEVDTIAHSSSLHYDYPSLAVGLGNQLWVSFSQTRIGPPTEHLVAFRDQGWTIENVPPAASGSLEFPEMVFSPTSGTLHFLRKDGFGINHVWGVPGAWQGNQQIDSLGVVPRGCSFGGSIYVALFRAGFENYKDISFLRLDRNGLVREREIIVVFGPYDQTTSHGFDMAVDDEGVVHVITNVMSYDSGYHVLYYSYRQAIGIGEESIMPESNGKITSIMRLGRLPTDAIFIDIVGKIVLPTRPGVYYLFRPTKGKLGRIVLLP